VDRLVGRDVGELLDGDARGSKARISEVGWLELAERLSIEIGLEPLEHVREFWQKRSDQSKTKTVSLRNCYIRRTVAVPLSMLRRNGAADTAMGATATVNKDAVERRMFYVLSSPNKKVFVAKKWISLLSA
jgi:hypothetical protein